jgi:eukaryotic-like serine/threonine-protein kinase
MTPERWQEINEVLAVALEKPPRERSAYLDQTCTEPALRREVESLIAAHEHESSTFTDVGRERHEILKNGSKVGPYEILAPLGAGGMGVVYRARDSRLEREVAIKFIASGVLADGIARSRFRKEALALAKLNHQNIAGVYDVGTADGADYLVMEYVPGQSLAQKLKSGPLRPVEAISLGEKVAAALQEAHERGIVHRDLKPANIIVTPRGHAKVLDFGIAKLLSITDRDDTKTFSETRGLVGTPLYMSPEQVEGAPVDFRTDLWSLGAVLYEALTGRPPFEGNGLALLRAITEKKPKTLRELRPDTPPEAEQIVLRALEKDKAKRYQSASEIAQDLSSAVARLSAPGVPPVVRELRVSLTYIIPSALLVLALAACGGWFYRRSERRHWAREEAIPKIAMLRAADKPLAAFLLLRQAEKYLPGDPQLARLAAENAHTVSVVSSPPGATVEIKDYLSPDSAWYLLGITPLQSVVIPDGYFRWRVSKRGIGEYIAAPITSDHMNFALDSEAHSPAGMSWVDGGTWANYIGFVGLVGPYNLPPFYIDRFEVTNRQFQDFVDKGGYDKREYWISHFIRNGREISWDDARALFRDSTGRPGPSTWEGGHYPQGQAGYPVSGVSWYEAMAYAAFVGKSLPVFSQWYDAASPDVIHFIVQESNISQPHLAPVGTFNGLGLYGTYDMAGNLREWINNGADANSNFILGGAWKSQTYFYSNPEAISPFDRSPQNGFRCVKNTVTLSQELTGSIRTLHRDFSRYKPASDEVFRAYEALYAYDKTPLNAKMEGVVQDTTDWREEKITFDAAYNNGERMAAYLFLPKNVRPPFQTVVFSPSARVLDIPNSKTLGDIKFFDYIIQSGRAVLYPVNKGTYERQDKSPYVGAAQTLTYLTERYKDLGRSLDYLQTRPDIEPQKIAYLGVSMGAAEGVIYTAIAQDRLKTAIFLDGGYFLDLPPRGGDQADFTPRVKIPVLMVNGAQDYVFSLDRSQTPMFQMLGSPPADKRHVVLDTPHDVSNRRPELLQAVLGWLDKYLGRID